jgi:hypothetical protein
MKTTESSLPTFQLTEAFFTTIEFRRASEVPEPLHVRFNVQLRVHGDRLPERLQVDLKLETVEDQPLTMVLEVVGLFVGVEGQLEPDSSELSRFVNERALAMLWSYMVQMTRLTTSQMGMSPVKLATPAEFSFFPEKATPEPSPDSRQDDSL